jgi:hypothetical protein
MRPWIGLNHTKRIASGGIGEHGTWDHDHVHVETVDFSDHPKLPEMTRNASFGGPDLEQGADVLRRLRTLIGTDYFFWGRRYRLIEFLADDGALVLETRGGLPPIQTDQYGQALYRRNDITQVPIFGTDRDGMSEELTELLEQLDT